MRHCAGGGVWGAEEGVGEGGEAKGGAEEGDVEEG